MGLLLNAVPLLKGTWGTPPSTYNEFVVITESATTIIYSKDFFSNYTRVTVGKVVASGFNGKDCGWYIEGTTTTNRVLHYTTDRGNTWETENAPTNSLYASCSDGGKYWYLGGDSTSSSKPKTGVSSVWTDVPNAMCYGNGTYGGRYGMVSRSGQYLAMTMRSKGICYNDNYLDPNSWTVGVYQNTYSSPIMLSHDNSGWCTAINSWEDKIRFNNAWDFTTQYTLSGITNPARAYAFKDARVGAADYVANKRYEANNSTVMSLLSSIDAMVATDDDHTFEFVVNSDTFAATINGNSVSNVAHLAFYVSRDGANCLYSTRNSPFKLYHSTNKGLTWNDVTPSTSYLSGGTITRIMQQWNRSH